ncbi:DUF3836 domain-containing protein [Bacteroides sp. 519]|uniref:DUF3836 domain-containing protein n=1 Tax=Bacteroides sp. 519 TaxID=2302937 RepID=UPI0013CFAA69|nr:DUF3836 domain-containing protein [Bacteroides sp. 519]NDV57560.1 DUF3836 domain-containing protein [Bacteroides sp. 519]
MNLFTATMVAASIWAATTGIGSKFAYNVKTENEVVTEQFVYKVDDSGKYLTQHLKYNFEYDSENRLTQKTTLSWNAWTNKWENSRRLTYSYSDNVCSIEYAEWNKNTNDFSKISERVSYSFDKMNQLTSYQAFKLNEKTNEWNMVQNHEINIPQIDLYWFALK